jgi:hypothetical protein
MSASSGDSEADYWLWARLFMFLRDPTSDGYLKRFDAELKVTSAVRAIAASFVDEHVRDLALAEEEGDSRHPDEINAQGERRLRQAIVQVESGGGDVARLTALARELATGSASGRGWELWELVRAAKHRLDDLRASAPAAAALVEAIADYRRVILDLLPDEWHDPDDAAGRGIGLASWSEGSPTTHGNALRPGFVRCRRRSSESSFRGWPRRRGRSTPSWSG